MIALALLCCTGSVIVFHTHERVNKKRFHSEIERFKERFATVRRLAIAMQTDWRGVLKKEKGKWVFELDCLEIATQKIAPLSLKPDSILFNGQPIEKMQIDFFSSGAVFPNGCFSFLQGTEEITLYQSQQITSYSLGSVRNAGLN